MSRSTDLVTKNVKLAVNRFLTGIQGERIEGWINQAEQTMRCQQHHWTSDAGVPLSSWSLSIGVQLALYYDNRTNDLHCGRWVTRHPKLIAFILSELGYPPQEWGNARGDSDNMFQLVAPLTLLACLAERRARNAR